MVKRELRRSKFLRRCECGEMIHKGDLYWNLAASPYHDDLGNPHWWHLNVCTGCAGTDKDNFDRRI